jgi:hypothetical protein
VRGDGFEANFRGVANSGLTRDCDLSHGSRSASSNRETGAVRVVELARQLPRQASPDSKWVMQSDAGEASFQRKRGESMTRVGKGENNGRHAQR